MSVERAKRELSLVEADLRLAEKRVDDAKARVMKLRYYIEVAMEFERLGDQESPRRRSGGKGEMLVARCEELISERGSNIPTRDLVDSLAAEGFIIGGKNPVGNLSGALSRAETLYNDRSTGWGLAKWQRSRPKDERVDEDSHSADESDIGTYEDESEATDGYGLKLAS